jgi:hypothetical protein
MKPSEWSDAIAKGEIGPGRSGAIWDDLVRKAERRARATGGAGQRFREELEMARMLQRDYESGGHLITYLSKEDERTQSATAITKRALERTVPANATVAEDIMDERARVIMKRDNTTYAKALDRVLAADPELYTAYEIQKSGLPAEEVLKRITRTKAVTARDGDESEDDTDECDPDAECDDDEMDGKRRKRRVAARRKHDYGLDDQRLWEGGGRTQASATVSKRAQCPNCWNQVDVERVRKSHACPACSASLTAV